nr:hypothetical protein [Acidobacteriota bacterium]
VQAVAATDVKAWITAVLITCAGFWSIAHLRWDPQARLSHDSIRYYAGAVSILESGRYTDIDGKPQQFWPPGLSLLYAALSRLTGRDPLMLVPLVDCTAYLLTMTALFLLGRIAAMRWWVVAIMMAAVAWNSHYISMHNKMWSEPLGVTLLVVTLCCAIGALRFPHRAIPFLVAACAAAAAAVMLRYAFVAVVPVLMAVALLARRPWLALSPLLAPAPALLAMSLLGASRGNRTVAVQSVPWTENVAETLRLADQFLPQRLTLGVGGVLVILLWIGAGVAFAFRARGRAGADALRVALLWCAAYAAFLPFAQMFMVPSFPLNLRILTPLYVGLVIVTATAIEAAISHRRNVAVLLALPLAITVARAARLVVAPPPLRSFQCMDRQWYIDALRRQRPAGTIASNAQGTVWLALRRPVLSEPPAQTYIWIDPRIACEGVVENATVPMPAGGTMGDGIAITQAQ